MCFSCFRVLPGSAEAQVICGGIVKRLLIAYFIRNISAKKYQNPFMCVKVIASQRWDVFFFETLCRVPCSNAAKMRKPLKLPWVPQTNETISAASGPKFTIL